MHAVIPAPRRELAAYLLPPEDGVPPRPLPELAAAVAYASKLRHSASLDVLGRGYIWSVGLAVERLDGPRRFAGPPRVHPGPTTPASGSGTTGSTSPAATSFTATATGHWAACSTPAACPHSRPVTTHRYARPCKPSSAPNGAAATASPGSPAGPAFRYRHPADHQDPAHRRVPAACLIRVCDTCATSQLNRPTNDTTRDLISRRLR